MKTPIDLSKFRPAQLPRTLIQRSRLVKRMEDASAQGFCLTLLRAPLGYGKTTLLSQFAAALGTSFGWYRIDRTDNEPVNFIGHLYRLLLKVPAPDEANTSEMWATIRSHLDGLVAPFTLLIDETEKLRSPRSLGYLETLLHSAPNMLRIVAASEGRPMLALGHLRRDSRLLVLDQNDLALTGEETQQLLSAQGIGLDPAFVYRLQAGSEGWVSGVLFWCAAYREMTFSGSQAERLQRATQQSYTEIAQFVQEELLNMWSPGLLAFVERTSVVGAFDLDLAATLSGDTNPGTMIRKLQQADLFITQHTGERLEFQFHPALRITAQQRLRKRDPQALLQLHQRAADWLLVNRFYAQAVYQYGRAKNSAALFKTVEEHTFDLLREGEINAIVDFLTHALRHSPSDHLNLAMTEASTLIVTNDIDRTRACIASLRRLASQSTAQRSDRVMQTIAFLRSHLALLGGNLRHGVELVSTALERYPEPNAGMAILHANSAGCLAALGRLNDARRQVGVALDQLQRLGFKGYTRSLQLLLGQIELAQGESERAHQRFFDDDMQHALGEGSGNFYDSFVHLGQGLVLIQQNLLPAATLSLTKAEKIALDFPHSAGLTLIFHQQACLLDAQGDTPRALARWDEARRLAAQFKQWRVYRLAGAWKARSSVRNRDQNYLLAWLKEWHWCQRHYREDIQPEETLAYAWVQRHLGQRAVCMQLLSELRELAEEHHNQRLNLDLLVLEASLAHDNGDQKQVMQLLDQALALACQYRLGQLLHHEGSELRDMFRQLVTPEARRQYELHSPLPTAEQLSMVMPQLIRSSTEANRLVEPVTRREREVLQRMARGQSNAQIAESLFVSLSTVKTHINNLFRKLEVNDREEALRKARSVGLLS
ncbi:hypothetical protein HKK52_04255 [Pseudomonas sp. ADAK2]|uniref:LuxR C-terminal-related transcriptional regulator n=1 Tax=unclassified Pseudomonas TaxID=196821 RepID=UPI001463DF9D|nr:MULTISPECIES: LuxR C-terminal-related transcriptional regulator [unclassified Pseudomonas]QJI40155.1 hypothetical protein HKK53_04250 [Pseudomonas sp. ADAK7]QJI46460.1 hypothetical protein HKK52_04255 [Pseudomonas sp. ADAK2]